MSMFHELAEQAVAVVDEFERRDGRAPTATELSRELSISVERTHFLLHRLVDHGVLVMIPSAFDDRFALEDPTLVTSIPDPDDEPSFAEAETSRRTRLDEQHGDIGRRFGRDYVDESRAKLFDDVRSRLSGRAASRANPLDGPTSNPLDTPPAGVDRADLFAKLTAELSSKRESKPNPLDDLGRTKRRD
ncbi:hypothetical protein K8I61_02480 [bacterium]|nr:hypothetical protein [bacterium]